MKKDTKNEHENMRRGEEPSADTASDQETAVDAESNASDHVEVGRWLAGLLRVIGWQSNDDRELTEAEADLILEVAASEPVSGEQRRRLLEGVLRRRFGTTAVPADMTGAERRGADGGDQAVDHKVTRRGPGPMESGLAVGESIGSPSPADGEKAQGPPLLGPAKSLVAQLKDRSGLRVEGVADGLGVDVGFLVDISEHASLVPTGARREIARRAMNAWGVPTAVTLATFDARAGMSMQKAASRAGAFQVSATTYEDIVRRSKLTDDEKRLWLGLN